MLATPSPDALQHPEWLGVWIGDTRVAFPTTSIHAVFSTQAQAHHDALVQAQRLKALFDLCLPVGCEGFS